MSMPAIVNWLDLRYWVVWLSVQLKQLSFIAFPFQTMCWKNIQHLLIQHMKMFRTMAHTQIVHRNSCCQRSCSSVVEYVCIDINTSLSCCSDLVFRTIWVSSTALSKLVHTNRPCLDGALRLCSMYTGVLHTGGCYTSSLISTSIGMPPHSSFELALLLIA